MLVAIPLVTTTLAATVAINGNGNSNAVEFGQGSQVAVACDTTINTAISETWDSTATRFRVTAIVLTGLNLTDAHTATTSDQGCGTKALKIGLVGNSGQLNVGYSSGATAGPITLVLPTVTTSAGVSPFTAGATGAGTSSQTVLLGGTAATDCTAGVTNCTLTFTLSTSLVGTSSLDPANVLRVALESA
jgi:hypothetical protein